MNPLKNTEPCPHCNRFANRGVSIDAIIVRDGKILLIQREVEPDKGKWATPGGYVGWDESVENAVARWVKEEIELSVTNMVYTATRHVTPNKSSTLCTSSR